MAPLPEAADSRPMGALLDDAKSNLEKGDYLFAMGLASEVISRMPGHLEAHQILETARARKEAIEIFGTAKELFAQGKTLEALTKINTALDLWQDYYEAAKFKEKLLTAQQEEKVDLMAVERSYLLTQAQRSEQSEPQKAKKLYQKLLSYFPKDASALEGIWRIENPKKALQTTPRDDATGAPYVDPASRKALQRTLQVRSAPEAKILIDNIDQGMTPLIIDFEPGTYHLRLERVGYVTKQMSVTIRANQSTTLDEKLEALEVEAEIESIPWGQLILDGRVIGNTPVKMPLRVGDHEIMLVRDGFHSLQERITIPSGKPYKAKFVLEPFTTR